MTTASGFDGTLADRLRAELAEAQHLAPMGIERIAIGTDALNRLPDEVSPAEAGVVILEDATPMRRAAEDLKALVAKLVGDAPRVVLGPPDGHAHADAATLAAAEAAVAGAEAVVSVGSGTITDIAKYACRGRDVPLVAIQTAVSVNGFSDDMSVILRDGVKRTVPSRWVTSLLVDTAVIRDAPATLNASGVGELLAMFTAPADWRLAQYVGLDDSYSETAVRVFRDHGDTLLRIAGGVRDLDDEALNQLAMIMTASGVALGVAGRTAPLSGTEHAISHLLDMSAPAHGVDVGLHGAQVGVAAVVVMCLWEHLLERLDPAELTDERAFPPARLMEQTVRDPFVRLDPSGAMGAECWSDYSAQLTAWHAARPAAEDRANRWGEATTVLRSLTGDAAAMVQALRDAGAPARFCELDPPVDADRARWAIKHCHLMRNRFTIADLAYLTGHWSDGDIDAVLQRAADLGGGL